MCIPAPRALLLVDATFCTWHRVLHVRRRPSSGWGVNEHMTGFINPQFSSLHLPISLVSLRPPCSLLAGCIPFSHRQAIRSLKTDSVKSFLSSSPKISRRPVRGQEERQYDGQTLHTRRRSA